MTGPHLYRGRAIKIASNPRTRPPAVGRRRRGRLEAPMMINPLLISPADGNSRQIYNVIFRLYGNPPLLIHHLSFGYIVLSPHIAAWNPAARYKDIAVARGAPAASRSVALPMQCPLLARSGYRPIFCRLCYISIESRAFALLVITHIATEVSSFTILDLKLHISFTVVT